jgi:hypothetical protein
MKLTYQGKEVDATEVEVISSNERWNEYQLADGKVLMFKLVVTAVYRIDGVKNPDGSTAYQFTATNVVRMK